jgi:Tfp pilus assembly protein PilN
VIRVNLLPKEERPVEKIEVTTLLPYTGAIVVILVVFFVANKISYYYRIKSELRKKQEELSRKEQEKREVEQIRQSKELLEKKFNIIKDLIDSKFIYPIFMEDLLKILPSAVYLGNFTSRRVDKTTLDINIIATALDTYSIADLVAQLESNTTKFSNIELGPIQQVSTGKEKRYNFTLSFRYKI